MIFLLSGSSPTAAQFQNCTPCDIPLTEEAGATVFGAFNCSEWAMDASFDDADSEICRLNRIAGVAFCGCEVPPDVYETCDLCPSKYKCLLVLSSLVYSI